MLYTYTQNPETFHPLKYQPAASMQQLKCQATMHCGFKVIQSCCCNIFGSLHSKICSLCEPSHPAVYIDQSEASNISHQPSLTKKYNGEDDTNLTRNQAPPLSDNYDYVDLQSTPANEDLDSEAPDIYDYVYAHSLPQHPSRAPARKEHETHSGAASTEPHHQEREADSRLRNPLPLPRHVLPLDHSDLDAGATANQNKEMLQNTKHFNTMVLPPPQHGNSRSDSELNKINSYMQVVGEQTKAVSMENNGQEGKSENRLTLRPPLPVKLRKVHGDQAENVTQNVTDQTLLARPDAVELDQVTPAGHKGGDRTSARPSLPQKQRNRGENKSDKIP